MLLLRISDFEGVMFRSLSSMVLFLSSRSSILRVDEIRFTPIDRRAWWDASTALRMVATSRPWRTVAIGVTWYFNPDICDKALTADLTYRPTLVPEPIGWMLNSAIVTIDFLGSASPENGEG
jgi:hypothetical protein